MSDKPRYCHKCKAWHSPADAGWQAGCVSELAAPAGSATKEYIGDSVYVDFDGGLVLTTENGYGPSNRIVLEPAVYEALVKYVERVTSPNK